MTDLPLVLTAGAAIFGLILTVLGFMIRRAIALHDEREIITQGLISDNAKQSVLNSQLADRAIDKAVLINEGVHQTLKDILSEAKLTNHRITELEVRARVAKELSGEQSHQR